MNKLELQLMTAQFILTLKNMSEDQIKKFVNELILDNNDNINKFLNYINYVTK